MKLELACGENTHAAEVEEDGGGYRVRIGEGPWHRYELHQLGAGMRALLGEGRPVIFSAVPQPGGYRLSLGGAAWDVLVGRPGSRRRADLVDGSEGAREVRAQMPGLVLRVVAAEGQQVARGELLLVIEPDAAA